MSETRSEITTQSAWLIAHGSRSPSFIIRPMNLYLSPNLGLNNAAFATIWNSLPEYRAAGLAQTAPKRLATA
ncbi:MAG: hypothetical protein KGS46_03345 [Chloroflexi bacterium]|nr:hypothetical protein [Chloroflexota bacterium]